MSADSDPQLRLPEPEPERAKPLPRRELHDHAANDNHLPDPPEAS